MSTDIAPRQWHEDWHFYAEHAGWACIAHKGDAFHNGYFNVCVVPAGDEPSGDHRGRRVRDCVFLPFAGGAEAFHALALHLLEEAVARYGELP